MLTEAILVSQLDMKENFLGKTKIKKYQKVSVITDLSVQIN